MSLVGRAAPVLPKSFRLLKQADFRFRPYRRVETTFLSFIYTFKGKGRLGVSLSKKVLAKSVARNRVRRLIRETYREKRLNIRALNLIDVNVLGRSALSQSWKALGKRDLEREFNMFLNAISKGDRNGTSPSLDS